MLNHFCHTILKPHCTRPPPLPLLLGCSRKISIFKEAHANIYTIYFFSDVVNEILTFLIVEKVTENVKSFLSHNFQISLYAPCPLYC